MSVSLNTIGTIMLVGVGKMGAAMARGWLDAGLLSDNLILVDPRPGGAARIVAENYGLTLNNEVPSLFPAMLVLAVKPQIIDDVMTGIAPVVTSGTLVVSIAAGIDLARLSRGLKSDRVVRAMPNTPAQIGKGITGAVASTEVTAQDRSMVDALLGAAGPVVWFENEGQLDAVTALSGSGPAYVFHMVEAMAAAGRAQGLDDAVADMLARQTVIGAAALLDADPAAPAVHRETVTSPNGTTAAGLAVLMGENGLGDLMRRTVEAARRRSEELGRS